MSGMSVRGATASRGRRVVLENVAFSAPAGLITALLGEAGAGKTTLLCAVAGLVRLDRGAVLLDGVDVTRLSARRRGVAMLAPGTALEAGGTVMAGLRRVAGGAGAAQAEAVAERLGLGAVLGRAVSGLSHGEGLLALAAARLARPAACVLVDEAAAGLDTAGATRLWAVLRGLAAEGRSVVVATRDARVALGADQLVLLGGGRVLQAGTPAGAYAAPADGVCARLTGEANLLGGQVRELRAGGFVWVGGGRFVQAWDGGRPALGARVTLCLRPERVALLGEGERADNEMEGVVGDVRSAGGMFRVEVRGEAFGLAALMPSWGDEVAPVAGGRVRVGWAAAAGVVVAG